MYKIEGEETSGTVKGLCILCTAGRLAPDARKWTSGRLRQQDPPPIGTLR